jgi:glutathione S-transferase
MATYWRESEMPLDAFPNIVRWIDGLMRIPSWAQPWPAEREALASAAG